MSIRLEYDFAIVGRRNVERELASMERRFVQSNAKMARAHGMSPGQARSVGRGAKADVGLAKSFQQIAQVGMRAERAVVTERRREQAKAHRERLSQIERERREAIRAARVAAQAAARAAAQRDTFRRATIGRGLGAAGDSLRGVGRTALAATGLAGGAVIATQLAKGVDLERRQRQVIINARGAGEGNAIEYGDLRKKISSASIESGVSQGGITGALEVFVQKTGDITTAIANMKNFATVAMATGASVEDIASAAADLSQKFDISKAEDMADALAVLTFQGKRGAFELKDIAANFPEMAAAAQRAGMSGVKGMSTLGGLAQIARTGTGSGAEASTAVQMMLTKLISDAGRLKSGEALGGKKVNVFEGGDATKSLRDVREVIADIISQSGGNLTQLQDVFDVRGIRAVSPMVSKYRETVAATPGTAKEKQAAGRTAILALIAEASDAGGKFSDVQRDAADLMQSTSTQLEIFNTQLNDAVTKDLLPALKDLVPHMTKLVPHFGKLVDLLADLLGTFAKNPLGNIGHIIAAKVALDIASAAVGPSIRDALVGAISGSGGKGGAAGGAGGGLMQGGVLGNVLAGLVIATLAVETFKAGTLLIDNWLPTNKSEVEGDIRRHNEGAAAKTPEEVRAVMNAAIAAKDENKPGTFESWIVGAADFFASIGAANAAAGGDVTPESVQAQSFGAEADAQRAKRDLALTDEISKLNARLLTMQNTVQKVEVINAPNRADSPTKPRQ